MQTFMFENPEQQIGKTFVEFSPNNSGGHWWVTNQNFSDLEKSGWIIPWCKDNSDKSFLEKDGTYMGLNARHAYKETNSLASAIEEWEHVTGLDARSLGCPCCGPPHSFTLLNIKGVGKDGYFDTKQSDSYYPEYPSCGSDYR